MKNQNQLNISNGTELSCTLRKGWPIISNIGTVSYQLTKYLAKLLSPLRKSQYTVNSTKEFIDMIKNERISSAYQITLFNVSSLFPTVPLDYTIDLALKRICDDKEFKPKLVERIWKICYCYVPGTLISLLKIIFTNKKMVLPRDPLLFQCLKEFWWYI